MSVTDEVRASAKQQNLLGASDNKADLQRVLASSLPADSAKTPAVQSRVAKIGAEITTATKQSFTDSINTTVRISSFIALLGAISGLFFVNRRPRPEEPVAMPDPVV